MNVQHLSNKIDEIKSTLVPNKPKVHIFSFCETFLNESVTDAECHIQGYATLRNDRKGKKGGGLISYVSHEMDYLHRVELQSDDIETLWIQIFSKNSKDMLFCFVYRPPSALTEWYKYFELQVQNAMKLNIDLIIMGDNKLLVVSRKKLCQPLK